MRPLLGTLAILMLTTPLMAASRPMTIDDLLAVKSVSEPQVSPDGQWVVYVVSELDRATEKTNSDLWLVSTKGGEPKRLTTAPGADNHPRWSPDGKTIAFTSTRGGSSQVWLLPLDGGEARPLTKLPIDVAGPIWSPRGDLIAFAAEVYPGKTPDETAAADKEKEANKSKALVFDRLMIRHWSAWDTGKRNHVFVADVKTGEAVDLTPKLEVNTPPGPFGGSEEYTFSPDGTEIAFTAEPLKDHAWSTNTDIWVVPTRGGEPKNLTAANPGGDAQPSYSPDGTRIAYLSQARAGFESDLWVLTVRNRDDGSVDYQSKALDQPVLSYRWASGRSNERKFEGRIFAVVDDRGTESILEFAFTTPAKNEHQSHVRVKGGINTSVQFAQPQEELVFLRGDAAHPNEIYKANAKAKADANGLTQLTNHNAPLLSSLDLATAEPFHFSGADGDQVSGWLIRPPGFDPNKKYPVLFLIHGGPQGSWHDEWHARWNYAMFAAPGYAVVAVNPRGSTGYGQKFTDQISQDWTGRVYDDLMLGLDHILKKYSFLDASWIAAAGGSYGGFMVNWIAGHSDRFKALISHAGVFDLTSKYGTTEELWFPEWEFGGTPWDKPEHYRDRSPSTFVKNFKTPTLVIHGALDYRVPDAQGLGMFTALQRRGVASRYLFFPDEGHWIVKPANRIVWWREVYGWLAEHLKNH
ncbi:Dipeptidyl aminopeptidase/acylaminoacyl peptidase [Singulisphaera sp. GP187]|uniref:dipeptidyl-peptidase 5 n=1 Tax=Singulisphaera sp. GP187 TaxID=1882752 RepID=UPI0009271674|nr:S9 family peptidase [Singulisphaera sp. GP187]SIN93021.1 Dipeptidyl aminopeptidase/acylaminoacyl peptidase [Singulisphaera sp. GP187]